MSKGYDSIAFEAATLGSLFYHDPATESGRAALLMLAGDEAQQAWESAQPESGELIEKLKGPIVRDAVYGASGGASGEELSASELHLDFNRLFIGPYRLPAPPWGSVYLDSENVIFGNETLELREWMRKNGLVLNLPEKEPEDHFGLILLMLSFAVQQGIADDQIDELLSHHLLSWAPRFLELFAQGAESDFYAGLAKLASITLDAWATRFGIEPEKRRLYR